MINLNNYEDYFLLYADNELSLGQRKQVELFVQLNGDLEEEFLMIQQSVLKPDHTITLEDKSILFRDSQSFMAIHSHEELFMLYHDNELSTEERTKIEAYVSQQNLQAEFSLFQQLKLKPDTSIVFTDKKLLYKKERAFRVIPLLWKSLAAAVIIGIGIWVVANSQNNKSGLRAGITVNIQKISTKATQQLLVTMEQQIKAPSESTSQQKPRKNRITPSITKTNDIALVKNNLRIPDIDNTVTNHDNTKEDNNKTIVINQANPNNDKIVIKTNDLPDPMHNTGTTSDKPITSMTVPVKNAQASIIAHSASYTIDPEPKNDNYVFYNITEQQFKKSKFGGFLRKVKRVIERKNPLSNFKNSPPVAEN